MLTLEQLKTMPPFTIFATGIAIDSEDDLFVANTGKELRWVAVRGDIHDWAIYCHFADKSEEWVAQHGEKIRDEEQIRKLVPCDGEAFRMYRY
ncbi:MAG: hypothetical protein ACP5JH_11960 [Bacteroidota bacterium]